MPHPTAFEDVYAVLATPFTEDLELDLAGLERHVAHLVGAGIGLLTVNGNTGEFFSLSVAEAKRVLACVVETVGTRATVVAGVGHDVKTAQDLAEHAAELGCAAVMVHGPVGPFATPEGIEHYVRAIAAVSPVGVIPYLRTRGLSTEMLLDLAADERVVAVKYALNDLSQVAELVSSTDVVWVCGTAELWAPAFWTAGVRTFTSGLANVSPRLALDLHRALGAGDSARIAQLWTALHPFETLRARSDSGFNVSVVKEAMSQIGRCGPEVRPPSSQLDDGQRRQVARVIETWRDLGLIERPGDAS